MQKKQINTKQNDLLFARQPIFDCNDKLYGYELLYRDRHPDKAVFEDGNKATSELLINYCGGIINDEEAPYVKIFINLTRNLLLSDYFFPLRPDRVVLEVLEGMQVDELLAKKIKELKNKGFEIALDDYCFEPEYDILLPLADYIKIDLLAISGTELKEKKSLLERKFLSSLPQQPVFLAEKVETKEVHDACRESGFELFQGYYLERPQLMYGKKIRNSSEVALQIVAKIQESDIKVDDLCHEISRDTKLSYQILKIINSPLCRLPRKVSSLKESIVYLGLDQIKKWAMAMALSTSSSQSTELFRILLSRARTCELYAVNMKYESPDSFFTVGLFSGIDAVLLADKKWLVEKLDFSDEMNEAILQEKGIKGEVLKLAIAIDHAQWDTTNALPEKSRIALFSAHEESINWAHNLCKLCEK